MPESSGLPPSPDVTISIRGGEINLSPFGFHLWADDFLAAERAYAAASPRPASLVPHFSCCQSEKLSLKAFLLLKGIEASRPGKKEARSQPELAI
jgi:hypothetical protein